MYILGMNKRIIDNFLAKALQQIQGFAMAEPDDRWLLAVSGGCDSMAMLHAICMLRRENLLELTQMEVGHLDHQLRGAEAAGDAEFTVEQSRTLDVDCTVGRIDVGREAREAGESIETAARRVRYKFLVETAQKRGCNKIVLAHNSDDNVETVLHRILRGAGLRGLGGIVASRTTAELDDSITIIRPLLKINRKEIETFMEAVGAPFRTDASNASIEYTRNRIRRELLPHLAANYNPEIAAAVGRLSLIAAQADQALRQVAQEDWPGVVIRENSDEVVFNAERLGKLAEARQQYVIRWTLEKLGVPLRDIGYRQIESIIKLAQFGGVQQLPGRLVITGQDGMLRVRKVVTAAHKYYKCKTIVVNIPGKTALDADYLQGAGKSLTGIITEFVDPVDINVSEYKLTKSVDEELIDYDKISGRLYVRIFANGDRFEPLGSKGSRKLGDFFTDRHIPTADRPRIALICDDVRIIWVSGLRIDHKFRITEQTSRILKLRID